MRKTDDDFINRNFTGFKVLAIHRQEHNDPHWRKYAECKCDCGNIFISRTDALCNKKGCKQCGAAYGGKRRILDNFEAAKRNFYSAYKGNASSRNLEFSLSRDDFDNIISKKCTYCGMSPQDQSYLSKSTKKYDKFYASGIDRLDNSLGYTLDNCVPCCTKCNMMKKTMSYTEFREHVFDIYYHLQEGVDNIFIKEFE